MDFDTVLLLKKKETYVIIINHYESLNERIKKLGLLYYFLNHLILLDFERTSFLSLQVSLKHLPGYIIKIYNIKKET